jgi:hypothetical protein
LSSTSPSSRSFNFDAIASSPARASRSGKDHRARSCASAGPCPAR